VPLALFRNARIYTPVDPGHAAGGAAQGALSHWEKGALLCRDGRIVTVGDETAVLAALGAPGARVVETETDCDGACMIPGFVDAHTHMCFLRPREREFLARLEGADYLSILRGGGGILSSVASVRAASEEDLYAATARRAFSALSLGTTTVEMKSGYGLSLDVEMRQLRVIARVGRETPLTVVPTLLAAHAVPGEYAGRTDDYAAEVAGRIIPEVARAGLARFCDVFCETGVFSVEQARLILEAARGAGLGLRLHADELDDTGGAALAASLGAASADHLLSASDSGLHAMAAAGTVAVLLPATAYSMRKPYARARAMVGAGVPVAMATDCNPGSSCTESMPFVFGLSVLQQRLTVAEALTAATLNAAYSLGLGRETGSLTPGKAGDFLLLDGETPGILAFRAGIPPVTAVYKAGALAWPPTSGAGAAPAKEGA
jgi:imidazolonepropionase